LQNPYGLEDPDVFFVNRTKNIVFYTYDDRGCEVIAQNTEAIRSLYDTYRNWVNGAYREETEERFSIVK